MSARGEKLTRIASWLMRKPCSLVLPMEWGGTGEEGSRVSLPLKLFGLIYRHIKTGIQKRLLRKPCRKQAKQFINNPWTRMNFRGWVQPRPLPGLEAIEYISRMLVIAEPIYCVATKYG